MNAQDVLDKINNFDINEVDWNTVGVWPLPAKISLWVVLIIAIVIGGFFFQVQELNNSLETAQRKEIKLKDEFETKALEARNIEQYRAQKAELEIQFDALKRQLPKDTEVPGLLEDVDEQGDKSGLDISKVDLQDEIIKPYYIELPIDIQVTGTYHDFGTFVSGVAGMPRIVTLHDYRITKDQDTQGLLSMTIQARTYRYKDQE